MKILVVVDYQNDFNTGSLGFEAARQLDPKIAARIRQAVTDGYIIIYTMDLHWNHMYGDSQEGKRLPVPHCIWKTEGFELYGETGQELKNSNAIVITKTQFGSLDLGKCLQATEDIIEIEFCGVVTNICVISNAIIAKIALPEARVVINAALCASNDETLHNKALDVMESLQMDIINREEA